MESFLFLQVYFKEKKFIYNIVLPKADPLLVFSPVKDFCKWSISNISEPSKPIQLVFPTHQILNTLS